MSKTETMQLQQSIQNVFMQLTESLKQITPAQYVEPSKTLFNATIGQHMRHIIEMFQCLELGYASGVVNYEKRKRDRAIETDKDLATALLQQVYSNLSRENRSLKLEADYDELSANSVAVETNYQREIIYNLEHTVHHMALIRVGINEVAGITLPESFGVASSTIKYRQECAQ